MTECDERVTARYQRVEKDEMVLPVVMTSEMMACGDREQRWKVLVLHDARVGGEDRTMQVIPMKMRGCRC